jgi:hypothetical protein
MFSTSCIRQNTFLTANKARNPLTVIRTKNRHFTEPDRMYRHKLLYFAMGLDQLPLRRTAILAADSIRHRGAIGPAARGDFGGDATGFKSARRRQIVTWHRRIQYQEMHLQHLMTRHAWGLLREYPSGGGKIAGRSDTGYFGFDRLSVNRYTREKLPATPREIYERRKL